MPLIKSTVGLDSLVQAPHVQSALGPVCMLCGRVVDEEMLVEGYPASLGGYREEPIRDSLGRFTGHTRSVYYPPAEGSLFAKVLVRHHGAEELRTFEMGSSNWDERDLSSYMRRTNWFDPTSHLGMGMGTKIRPDADFRGEDPAPKGTAFSDIVLASERSKS